MSGILFGLTALFAAYIADLLAAHWGFHGRGPLPAARGARQSRRRRISSKPNGQPISRSALRRTGMRSA